MALDSQTFELWPLSSVPTRLCLDSSLHYRLETLQAPDWDTHRANLIVEKSVVTLVEKAGRLQHYQVTEVNTISVGCVDTMRTEKAQPLSWGFPAKETQPVSGHKEPNGRAIL